MYFCDRLIKGCLFTVASSKNVETDLVLLSFVLPVLSAVPATHRGTWYTRVLCAPHTTFHTVEIGNSALKLREQVLTCQSFINY